MAVKIEQYRLAWNAAQGTGVIELKPFNQEAFRLSFRDGGSFSAAVSILQNEDPVYFDEDSSSIYCGAEEVD